MKQEELIELIERHGRDIYSFCLSLTKNQTEADDLYQESFLSLIRKVSSVSELENPKSYILSIVVHRWKDSRRKFARRQRLAPVQSLDEIDGSVYTDRFADGAVTVRGEAASIQTVSGGQPEEEALQREMQREIRRAVAELDEKFKIPVFLYYMEDMSVLEIAKILHLPAGTVKSRLYKARKALKERMVKLGYDI
ncbi:MAG: RNA polymerase sigma factor [Lachnospiraceae bacterium]|nr:RNA polymerase sigma factor [Lachnospiraceae bacterium]